jgi:exonuclease VII large subunit
MAANVHSLDAIQAVRAALVVFRDDLDQAVSTIDVEMRRVLDWLEHDRPQYWKKQLREARDGVTEAQQALHRCLMYPINDERPACYEERAELKKAQARLAYCDEKSERLRHWIREVRHEMSEYQGRISQLKDVVEIDSPQAMAILDRLIERIQEYEAVSLRGGGGPSSVSATESFAREIIPEVASGAAAQETPEAVPVNDDSESAAESAEETT